MQKRVGVGGIPAEFYKHGCNELLVTGQLQ